jgi:cell division protein FtsA
MNRKGDKALIVGLDIGTSKVVALVGEYSPGNPIEVIGIGSHESRGLKRGVVVDIESTVQSIQRAVEEAELMAGCEIRSVYASISGNHVQCRNSPGIVPIRDGEVTYADLDRVLEAAKAVAIPADQKILHAIPREYVLDDSQEGIRNPVGMTGVRLEVHAHLVVCAQSAAANISKCVQRCGLQIDDLILSSLASSTAVLTGDERELGVVLVDLGAGTTDLAVFVQGAICHTASLPIAGDKVTEDIAHMLRTPTPEAEQIKVRYACALAQLATSEESIQVPSVGDRPPRRLRGNFRDGASRTAPLRLRAARARRHGVDRRRFEDGRRRRTGRGDAADAGACGHSTTRHGSWRSGRQSGACHRRRPAADGQPDRASAPSGDSDRARRHVLQQVEELVPGGILMTEGSREPGTDHRNTGALALAFRLSAAGYRFPASKRQARRRRHVSTWQYESSLATHN